MVILCLKPLNWRNPKFLPPWCLLSTALYSLSTNPKGGIPLNLHLVLDPGEEQKGMFQRPKVNKFPKELAIHLKDAITSERKVKK